MIRVVDSARLLVGLTVVARPDVAVRLTRSHSDPTTRRVIRVFGARCVTQGLAATVVRGRWMAAADAAVDLVHAASMGGIAYLSPPHRRLAATSGVIAVLFAAGDLATPRDRQTKSRSLEEIQDEVTPK